MKTVIDRLQKEYRELNERREKLADFIYGEEFKGLEELHQKLLQAQALVYSLMKDDQIKNLDAKTIQLITDKIIEGVLGHMLEDIVIFETKRELVKNSRSGKKSVYKIRFENHEYDMLIYDSDTNTCEAYEIKHTKEPFPNQYRHLINEDFVQVTEKRFGQITKRCVLYRGKTYTEENGVEYKNVEEFLCEFCFSYIHNWRSHVRGVVEEKVRQVRNWYPVFYSLRYLNRSISFLAGGVSSAFFFQIM